MMTIFSSRKCWRCSKRTGLAELTGQELMRRQKADGAWDAGYICLECNGWTGVGECKGYWIKHETLKREGINLDDLRVLNEDAPKFEPCVICGNPGQHHHWAPQCVASQFEDHSKWPTAPLCQKHHAEWHRIVTPDYELLKRNNPQQQILNGDTNDQ